MMIQTTTRPTFAAVYRAGATALALALALAACGDAPAADEESRRGWLGRLRESLSSSRQALTRELLPELVKGYLDRGDLSPEQLLQKLRPAQSSNLRGLSLGDQTLGEPMNGCGEPHFCCELGRGLPQG